MANMFGRKIGIKAVAVVGGLNLKDQYSSLKKGADLVICTPGRMIEIINSGKRRLVSLD